MPPDGQYVNRKLGRGGGGSIGRGTGGGEGGGGEGTASFRVGRPIPNKTTDP